MFQRITVFIIVIAAAHFSSTLSAADYTAVELQKLGATAENLTTDEGRALTAALSFRTWKDKTGEFNIIAKLVGIKQSNDSISLKPKAGQDILELQLDQLSASDIKLVGFIVADLIPAISRKPPNDKPSRQSIPASMEDVKNFPARYIGKYVVFRQVQVLGDVERNKYLNNAFTLSMRSKREEYYSGSGDLAIITTDGIAQRLLKSIEDDMKFLNCSVYCEIREVEYISDKKPCAVVSRIEIYNVGGQVSLVLDASEIANADNAPVGSGQVAQLEDIENFPKRFIGKSVILRQVQVMGRIARQDAAGNAFSVPLRSTRDKYFTSGGDLLILTSDEMAVAISNKLQDDEKYVNCTVYADVVERKYIGDQTPCLLIKKIEVYNAGGEIGVVYDASNLTKLADMPITNTPSLEEVASFPKRFMGKSIVLKQVQVLGNINRNKYLDNRFTVPMRSTRDKYFTGNGDLVIITSDAIAQAILGNLKSSQKYPNCSVYGVVAEIDYLREKKPCVVINKIEVFNAGGDIGEVYDVEKLKNKPVPMASSTPKVEEVQNFPERYVGRSIKLIGVQVMGNVERNEYLGNQFAIAIRSARDEYFSSNSDLAIVTSDAMAYAILGGLKSSHKYTNCTLHCDVTEVSYIGDKAPCLVIKKIEILNAGGQVGKVLDSATLDKLPVQTSPTNPRLEDIQNFPARYVGKSVVIKGVEVLGGVERNKYVGNKFVVPLRSKRGAYFAGGGDVVAVLTDRIAQQILGDLDDNEKYVSCSLHVEVTSIKYISDSKPCLVIKKIEVFNVGGNVGKVIQ